uniref:Transcription factor 23 n=1 Tax=Podarcis muralis TaxID=64176 RepID=A0A670HYS0_PODMU
GFRHRVSPSPDLLHGRSATLPLSYGPPRRSGWRTNAAREVRGMCGLGLASPAAGQGPLVAPPWADAAVSPRPQGRRRTPIAAREQSRVQTLRQAFLALQAALPAVPPGTKLSKLDILLLATSYITHLSQTLQQGPLTPRMPPAAFLHPLKVRGGEVAPLPAPGGWAQMGPDARGAQP